MLKALKMGCGHLIALPLVAVSGLLAYALYLVFTSPATPAPITGAITSPTDDTVITAAVMLVTGALGLGLLTSMWGGDGEPEDEPTAEAASAAPTDKESAPDEPSVHDDPSDGSEQIPPEEPIPPEEVPPAGEAPSSEEMGSPQESAPSSDAASPPESEDEPDVPEFAADPSGEDAFDDSFGDDREADRPRDRTRDSDAEADTVQCDNCSSTVKASASTCPACGADLDSGWFS